MRIAVLNRDKCQPKKCNYICIKFCPKVRTGEEAIVIGERGKPEISEILCAGCGICVHKCPFDAISIVNIPEELEKGIVHRYGKNGFALYGLPIPKRDKIVGILGPNGIGKSTCIRILSGALKPNFGGEKEFEWDEIIKRFSGSELQNYFKRVSEGRIRISVKPQYIDGIPKIYSGEVVTLLKKVDERGILKDLTIDLQLENCMKREIRHLSGGELQRVAIAATLMKDAEFYFFDEITPYLDIYQRMNVTSVIREYTKGRSSIVVEHDLAILDLLADLVHIAYGKPSVYGIITRGKSTRNGVNQYLDGYLREENVRIRSEPITFEVRAPQEGSEKEILITFNEILVDYGTFKLRVESGEIRRGEVIGVLGPNGIGKSTFAKVLAGVLKPVDGEVSGEINVSYKPQYLSAEDDERTVRMLLSSLTPQFGTSYYETEFIKPLQLRNILDSRLCDLSGGELQRVAIAATLSRDADLYLLDEPSAHLDIEQRIGVTRVLRRFAESSEKSVLVVDHDIYMIDLLSERLMIFSGEPGVRGEASPPLPMREGMNRFLKELGITFRRDEETKRPRINKLDSQVDRWQKSIGEYYYVE
jgi:ATP-binding cassette subfamily E protein 1